MITELHSLAAVTRKGRASVAKTNLTIQYAEKALCNDKELVIMWMEVVLMMMRTTPRSQTPPRSQISRPVP